MPTGTLPRDEAGAPAASVNCFVYMLPPSRSIIGVRIKPGTGLVMPPAAFRSLLIFLALGTMARPAASQDVGANHAEGNGGYRDQCNSSAPDVGISACGKIIEDRRESADIRGTALQNRAFYYQQKGDLDRSIADYSTVLTFSNGRKARAKICLNLGLLYFQKGAAASALDKFNEAVSLDPKMTSAYRSTALQFS